MDAALAEAILRHYGHAWGRPWRRYAFHADGRDIGVLTWDGATTPQRLAWLATIGASGDPFPHRPASHRHEYVMALLEADDHAAHVLAALADYEAFTDAELGYGHTVPVDAPLDSHGSPMRSVVLDAAARYLPPLVDREVHVEFLLAIPIHDAELAFKKQHGWEALRVRWERARVPFWDLGRPSSV